MTHEIGKILIKKGQYKKAISVFEEIMETTPNDLRANFLLGKIYYDLNNLKKSLFFYKKCNQIQANSPNILFNLALVLQGLGKIKESKKTYINYEILKINPSYLYHNKLI